MKGSDLMIKIQTLSDVQALEQGEHLPAFYIEEIKSQFRRWYEAEDEGEKIQDFSLPSHACIYHFNHRNDWRILQSYVNDIEYVDTERIDGLKYFRIGIMQDHQMSIIYCLGGTLPYKTEKWLEN